MATAGSVVRSGVRSRSLLGLLRSVRDLVTLASHGRGYGAIAMIETETLSLENVHAAARGPWPRTSTGPLSRRSKSSSGVRSATPRRSAGSAVQRYIPTLLHVRLEKPRLRRFCCFCACRGRYAVARQIEVAAAHVRAGTVPFRSALASRRTLEWLKTKRGRNQDRARVAGRTGLRSTVPSAQDRTVQRGGEEGPQEGRQQPQKGRAAARSLTAARS